MQEEQPLLFHPTQSQGIEVSPISEAPEQMASAHKEELDMAAHWKALVGRVHGFRESCALPEDVLQSLSPSDGQRLLDIISQSRGREDSMLPDAIRGSRLLAAALERAQIAGVFQGVEDQTGDMNEERKLIGRLQKRMLGVLDSTIKPYEVFGISPDELDENVLQHRYEELYRIRIETQNRSKDSDEDWVNFYLVDRARTQLLAELKARQQASSTTAA